jgi:hypothetical protein
MVNISSIIYLIIAEAWFLQGYFSGEIRLLPSIMFFLSIVLIFSGDVIKSIISKHDKKLFDEFLQIMPVDTFMHSLGAVDFRKPFPKNIIKPLATYLAICDDDSRKYADTKLEKSRKKFCETAKILQQLFHIHTMPVSGESDLLSTLPDTQINCSGNLQTLSSSQKIKEQVDVLIFNYHSFIDQCKTVIRT